MTYDELLEITEKRKQKALRDLKDALKGPGGFLVKAELERKPGTVAWLWLADDFCKTLAEHIEEFIDQAGGVDSPDAREIGDIYMAYEDGRSEDLWDLLPIEAKLFEEEA